MKRRKERQEMCASIITFYTTILLYNYLERERVCVYVCMWMRGGLLATASMT